MSSMLILPGYLTASAETEISRLAEKDWVQHEGVTFYSLEENLRVAMKWAYADAAQVLRGRAREMQMSQAQREVFYCAEIIEHHVKGEVK